MNFNLFYSQQHRHRGHIEQILNLNGIFHSYNYEICKNYNENTIKYLILNFTSNI